MLNLDERTAEERRVQDDRRTGDGFTLPSSVWIHFIGFVISALMVYAAVNARVSVVESKQLDSEHRMQRIEDKVDQLLLRVK